MLNYGGLFRRASWVLFSKVRQSSPKFVEDMSPYGTRRHAFSWHKKTCPLVAQEDTYSCGTSATVPTHVDRSIARSIDRSLGGGSHVDPRSMNNHATLTQKSSQNRPKIGQKPPKIGPRGPPEDENLWKMIKKMRSRTPPRDPFWGPLGDIGHHLADILPVLGCRVGGLLDDRRFDGKSVRSGQPDVAKPQ